MNTATGTRTHHGAWLTKQMNDLEKFMGSPSYTGGAAHSITLDSKISILLGDGSGGFVTFPAGSTLTRMHAERLCILQHALVGCVTFRWDDQPGEGTFVPPGR